MKSKKLGKISSRTKTEIFKASVFDASSHKTERSAVAVLMHWMRGIIEKKNLALGLPDVETTGADGKMPDTVIYESRRSQRILCVIEAKQPFFGVFDEKELKEPAREKATKRKAPYFALTNFKSLIWFSTEKVNAMQPEEEQILDKYTLSEIENLDYVEQTRYCEPIKRELEKFLTKLYSVYSGKEPEPRLAIDELLIFKLQEKIRVLSTYYNRIIDDQCHKDSSFARKLRSWFTDQGWSFTWQPQDFDKAARQTAYLLVNKILFYNLLHAKRPQELDPLEISESLTKGSVLKTHLQGYFSEVLKIDYETIYTTDFIDTIAFPDVKEVVREVRELVNLLKRYDFSKIGYDVIGRIFERLIPQFERHNLGQYFTNPDVVDLILNFCLQHEDEKLLDPACGAGTFLVRAYQHKKLMNPYKNHEDILETVWGNDIAKFPAHLATINLSINDLGVDKNYPNILQEDFFTLLSDEGGFALPDKYRKRLAVTLGRNEREVPYPRLFDAVVGNPPYTRQEEISEISPEDAKYKEDLIEKALYLNNKKLANIGKRAGIHAYFFVHGTKFLKDGGYFGFIVSNSWLDVDYGKGLQKFFLKNYKIIAIIESKVERWFEEADINTCIIILQKCKDKKERDENLVRFVYLKKPLRLFIPPAQDMWEKQIDRLKEIDKLKKTILAHYDFRELENLRIFPKRQSELWEEGTDPETGKYAGAKWGKYIRAPKIFFKILEKGREKLIPLKKVADVRFGIKTGANGFFYLTEEEIKRRRIEKEFWLHQDEEGNWVPNYVIKSPRECKSIVVRPEELKYRVLMIHKDKKELKRTNILKYIKEGERKGFHRRPTCASRKRWYDLGKREPGRCLWEMIHFKRLKSPLNERAVFVDHNLFEILPKIQGIDMVISAQFNCIIFGIFREIGGRVNLGQGSLKTEGVDIEKFLILNPKNISKSQVTRIKETFEKFSQRATTLSVFEELGACTPEEVSFGKVKPDRRELDKIIMGEILGLTDEEQLEVYRAVIDLVKSRIEKAKSFGKRRKTKEGLDIDAVVNIVMEKIADETLGKFYKEKILNRKPLSTRLLPKVTAEVKIEQELYGWRLYYSPKRYIKCHSEEEARYLKIFIDAGLDNVKVPKDDEYLKAILPEMESLKEKIDEAINSYLKSIVSTKLRNRLEHRLWTEIMS